MPIQHLKVKIENAESNSFCEALFPKKSISSFKRLADSDYSKVTKYFIKVKKNGNFVFRYNII